MQTIPTFILRHVLLCVNAKVKQIGHLPGRRSRVCVVWLVVSALMGVTLDISLFFHDTIRIYPSHISNPKTVLTTKTIIQK